MAGKDSPKKAPGENPNYRDWVDKLTNSARGDMTLDIDENDKSILAEIFKWINDKDAQKDRNLFTSERTEQFEKFIEGVKSDSGNTDKLNKYITDETFKVSDPFLHAALVELKSYVDGINHFKNEPEPEPAPAEKSESVPGMSRSSIPIDINPPGTVTPPIVGKPPTAEPPQLNDPPNETPPATGKPGEGNTAVVAPSVKPEDVESGGNVAPPPADSAREDGGEPAGVFEDIKKNIESNGGSFQDVIKTIFTSFTNLMKYLNFSGLGGGAGTISSADAKKGVDFSRVKPGEKFKGLEGSVPSVEYVKKILGLDKPDIKDAATLFTALSNLNGIYEYKREKNETEYLKQLQVGDIVFFHKQGQPEIADSVAVVSRVENGSPKEIFIKRVSTDTDGSVLESNLAGYDLFKTRYMGFFHKKKTEEEAAPAVLETAAPVTPPAETKTPISNPPEPLEPGSGVAAPPNN